MTPKEDTYDKKSIVHSTIKTESNPYLKDSLSPKRESMFER